MSEPHPSGRHWLGGWLLMSVVALAIVAEIVAAVPEWLPGALAWAAAFPLWHRLGRRQRMMVVVMGALGAAGMAWGALHGQPGLLVRALSMNTMIIAMLVGVAFLPLVSVREPAGGTPSGAATAPLRRGRLALLQTIVGVHVFGAVINLTAALIAADRLRRRPGPGVPVPDYPVPPDGTLTRQQAMALGTAFSTCAFWSPFMGAMAVALTVAPGSSLFTLVLTGLPLGMVATLLLWAWLSTARFDHARDFEGYPLDVGGLWIPFALAIGVFAIHEWQPAWSIQPVIAILAIAITAVALAVRQGVRAAAARLRRHVPDRLPGLAGELWIFLAAGLLASGVSAMLAVLEIGAPFSRFGGLEASLVFVACTLIAWAGLHPIVTIPLAGVLVAPLSPAPDLLAMAFLCTWAIGLPACATSGTVLAMQARYGIPIGTYIRWNLPYVATMMVVSIVALNLYGYWLY